MTNAAFECISDYDDVEIKNAYKEYTEKRGVSHDDMMCYISKMGRDNARTPMQWDDGGNAGFSDGKPWLKINPNYKFINAKSHLILYSVSINSLFVSEKHIRHHTRGLQTVSA